MLLKSYDLGGRRPVILAVLAVTLTLALLYLPVRALIADFRYGSIQTILDNKDTEVLDIMSLSANSLPDYLKAVEQARSASAFEPSRARYHKSLSDIYVKLGRWAQRNELLGAALPQGALSSKDAYEAAMVELKRTIELEPAYPDNHFAMGILLDVMKAPPELSENEYERAAQAFPVNAPLRYAIVQQYFLTDRPGHALEHARKLAALDDTYKLSDRVDKKEVMETRSRHYLTMLSKSYLFQALEIAWRVSKDPQVVKGIVPDNDEAREVLGYFFELNGIDE